MYKFHLILAQKNKNQTRINLNFTPESNGHESLNFIQFHHSSTSKLQVMIGLANLCCFGRALASRSEKRFDEWRVFPISLWPIHQPWELNHQSWECSIMGIKPSIMFNHANQTINHGNLSNHGNWTHQSWEFKFRNPANKCVCGMVACWHVGMLGRLKNQTCILRTCGHQKYFKVNYKATQPSFTDRVTGHFWWWL